MPTLANLIHSITHCTTCPNILKLIAELLKIPSLCIAAMNPNQVSLSAEDILNAKDLNDSKIVLNTLHIILFQLPMSEELKGYLVDLCNFLAPLIYIKYDENVDKIVSEDESISEASSRETELTFENESLKARIAELEETVTIQHENLMRLQRLEAPAQIVLTQHTLIVWGGPYSLQNQLLFSPQQANPSASPSPQTTVNQTVETAEARPASTS